MAGKLDLAEQSRFRRAMGSRDNISYKEILDPFRFLLVALAGWMNQAAEILGNILSRGFSPPIQSAN